MNTLPEVTCELVLNHPHAYDCIAQGDQWTQRKLCLQTLHLVCDCVCVCVILKCEFLNCPNCSFVFQEGRGQNFSWLELA